MGWFKNKVRQWLNIERAVGTGITILEPLTFESAVLQNKIWYRGDACELQQFYSQIDDMIGNTSFWAARSSCGVNFRKIHSGLPALIVDTLSDIVCNDLIDIRISDERGQKLWKSIASDNKFDKLLKSAVRNTLALGDGAFKISFDESVSKYPIIEFFGADRVRFEYVRGRVDSVVFLTEYVKDGDNFILEEEYSRDGVLYRLLDKDGIETHLETLEETAGLNDIINPERFMMAIPLIFDDNPKFFGRGKSIFEGKLGAFDGLDEAISQWIDALRDGRAIKYIPSNLLPRDYRNGAILKPNSFDSRYIQTDADMTEGSNDNKIKVIQPDIKTDALLASYINFLDICLQGIIAPSTLGIDVKKMDNAEAQREKEKATLYTRNRLICVLQNVLPQVVCAALRTWDLLNDEQFINYDVKAEFGEYANPSFEAQIETIGKARQYGLMSLETVVTQLYGNTWTDEQKWEEVERLRNEAFSAGEI